MNFISYTQKKKFDFSICTLRTLLRHVTFFKDFNWLREKRFKTFRCRIKKKVEQIQLFFSPISFRFEPFTWANELCTLCKYFLKTIETVSYQTVCNFLEWINLWVHVVFFSTSWFSGVDKPFRSLLTGLVKIAGNSGIWEILLVQSVDYGLAGVARSQGKYKMPIMLKKAYIE